MYVHSIIASYIAITTGCMHTLTEITWLKIVKYIRLFLVYDSILADSVFSSRTFSLLAAGSSPSQPYVISYPTGP